MMSVSANEKATGNVQLHEIVVHYIVPNKTNHVFVCPFELEPCLWGGLSRFPSTWFSIT